LIHQSSGKFLKDALHGIGSLFFLDICPYCQGEPDCLKLDGRSCEEWWSEAPSIRFIDRVPIYSVVPYDDRAMGVVLAAKERGERRARQLIVTAVASVIATAIETRTSQDSPLILVPIPPSRRALKVRGEDFIQRISVSAMANGRFTDPDQKQLILAPILRWRRDIEDQSELSITQRRQNLAEACEVDEARVELLLSPFRLLSNQLLRIILIDDVVTSGATMAAAISAISHSTLGSRSSLSGITACHSARPL
jgi:predicted amidophosphoribosyltransferase